jgi:hypothetical protein
MKQRLIMAAALPRTGSPHRGRAHGGIDPLAIIMVDPSTPGGRRSPFHVHPHLERGRGHCDRIGVINRPAIASGTTPTCSVKLTWLAPTWSRSS